VEHYGADGGGGGVGAAEAVELLVVGRKEWMVEEGDELGGGLH